MRSEPYVGTVNGAQRRAATIEPIFDISRELLRAVLQSGSNRADEKN